MNKTLLVPALAITFAAVTGLGVAAVRADDTSTSSKTIVQKIAERFNLKEAEVQQVFDEDRSAHKAQMQQRIENKLDEAVKDGKLTEAQKQLILDKQKELQAKHEANFKKLKDMSDEERQVAREAMKKELEDLKQWAKDNNIDTEYLMGKFHIKVKGGHGMGHREMIRF